ncbi:hypothetical protein GCM10010912_33620 [Paenibacillus albidus]|uniref:Peptidase M50 domain-containing protein n=2 Tax=Paenibacillus albidus TaxID=2041023 RepID=A0A917CEE5_9BACL|nr:hypothetical protein GCM10010912_33620 [Paenibacillus albidus]
MAQNNKKPASGPLKWLGGVAVMFLLKGKAILSMLKIGKIASPLISMIISIWAYALIYPWEFAIGFVLLLLVHEMGHVFAAKRVGLPVSAPLFIPFLGALISMKRFPMDAKTEAYIAFGGPVLGTIGSVAVFGAAYYMDSPLLYALSYVGFMLNLINLLPIHPLDGGRIATAVTRWLWLVGLVGGLAVVIYLKSILFFIIWALFAYDLYNKYVKRRNQKTKTYASLKSFMIPIEGLREQGVLIPGPEHKRALPFTTYSDLNQQQYLRVRWDGLDYEGTAELPQQCLVESVQVKRLEEVFHEDKAYLNMYCEVRYQLFENDRYYDVSSRTRWTYGAAYFVLAGVLAGMMYLVHVVGNVNL